MLFGRPTGGAEVTIPYRDSKPGGPRFALVSGVILGKATSSGRVEVLLVLPEGNRHTIVEVGAVVPRTPFGAALLARSPMAAL